MNERSSRYCPRSSADANLTEADPSYANLFRANLRDAQLTVGALSEEQLRNVRNKDKIVWVPKKDDLDLDPSTTGSQTPDPV
jgi:fructose-1,6-bisphosphatase/inositol monophosphatase family enzyme